MFFGKSNDNIHSSSCANGFCEYGCCGHQCCTQLPLFLRIFLPIFGILFILSMLHWLCYMQRIQWGLGSSYFYERGSYVRSGMVPNQTTNDVGFTVGSPAYPMGPQRGYPPQYPPYGPGASNYGGPLFDCGESDYFFESQCDHRCCKTPRMLGLAPKFIIGTAVVLIVLVCLGYLIAGVFGLYLYSRGDRRFRMQINPSTYGETSRSPGYPASQSPHSPLGRIASPTEMNYV